MQRRDLLLSSLALASLGAARAQSSDFSTRALKLIVPQPPGGGFDLLQLLADVPQGCAGRIAGRAAGQGQGAAQGLQVPYKGAQAAYQDLLGGRVDLLFDLASTARAQINGGTVRGLAISGAQRNAMHPELPTLRESGADLDLESCSACSRRRPRPPRCWRACAASSRARPSSRRSRRTSPRPAAGPKAE